MSFLANLFCYVNIKTPYLLYIYNDIMSRYLSSLLTLVTLYRLIILDVAICHVHSVYLDTRVDTQRCMRITSIMQHASVQRTPFTRVYPPIACSVQVTHDLYCIVCIDISLFISWPCLKTQPLS